MIYRFGLFEFDPRNRELRRDGVKVKLQDQPLGILTRLVEHPNELVSRTELCSLLWPTGTFVDFENGLNMAVKRLREALNDTADRPAYIETVPRYGYKFIGPVSAIGARTSEPYAIATKNERNAGAKPHTARTELSNPARSSGRMLAMAVVAVALVLTVVRAAMDSRRPHYAASRMRMAVPLTSYPGVEFAPSFSPDGGMIAYEQREEQFPFAADLYIKQVSQERAVRLTNRRAKFLEPSWSPDGQTIAYVTMDGAGVAIYLMPALGGNERMLTRLGPGYPFSFVSWSADSQWIAFTKLDESGYHRLHAMNVRTLEDQIFPLANPDCIMSTHPTFSPDGKQLASICFLKSWASRVYVQPADGATRDIRLIATPAAIDTLTWSADSQSVIYGSELALWRVAIERGSPEKIGDIHDASMPTTSRGGNRLAYVLCNTYHSEIWQTKISVTNRAEEKIQRLISSSRGQRNPRFSPDGVKLAFESDRSGQLQIWIADADGSNATQLTSSGHNGMPSWSPDGQNIVFESRASGHGELYVVSVNREKPRRLETGTADASSPWWSKDGKWIYFASGLPQSIFRVSSSGGSAALLTKKNGAFPQESADGERVFFAAYTGQVEIWSVPSAGGQERRETVLPEGAQGDAWTVSGDGIHFVRQTDARRSLEFYDFATRRIRSVANLHDLAELHGRIALSPDGNVLYSGLEHSEADIMLVDGFQ
jgi:Tol biopolymer transport system component/DNA-binding winged helix-turn-helix (wHTH) protein